MNTPDLVADPEDLSPEWFTQVLRSNNYSTRVTGFKARRIGTGQVAR